MSARTPGDAEFIEAIPAGLEVDRCPFCFGFREGPGSFALLRWLEVVPGAPRYWTVICHLPRGCGATGPFGLSPARAVALWNTRRG